tara:strand:+ start:158 stop:586 length:429 start_codon:yes stop_codon:yes gene_type:complete
MSRNHLVSFENPNKAQEQKIVMRFRRKAFLPVVCILFILMIFNLLQTNFFPSSQVNIDQLYIPSLNGSVLNFIFWHLLSFLLGQVPISFLIAHVVGMYRCDKVIKRIKSNCCIKCNYDLRMHNNQCPECGEFQTVLYKKLQY